MTTNPPIKSEPHIKCIYHIIRHGMITVMLGWAFGVNSQDQERMARPSSNIACMMDIFFLAINELFHKYILGGVTPIEHG